MITASSLDLALTCPTSQVLPQIRDTNAGADKGKATHTFLERVQNVGVEKALEASPEDLRPWFRGLDMKTILQAVHNARPEIALGWDPETDSGRELRTRFPRDYSDAGPGWLCGTADYLEVTDDCVIVTDTKTGKTFVKPPAENPQFRFLALAAARAFNRPRAIVRLHKIQDDGSVYAPEAELDEIDLDTIAAELRDLCERIEKAGEAPETHAVVGPHCTWCRARAHCSALVREAGAIVRIVNGENGHALTRDLLKTAWPALQAMEGISRRARQSMERLVGEDEVDLGNGQALVFRPGRGRAEIDVERARDALAQSYDEAVAEDATVVRESMTEESIGAALKTHGYPRKKSEALRVLKQWGARVAKRGAPKLQTVRREQA